VCITTSGPGALNALTGCAAAYTEGVPVLFISGQTPTNFLGSGTRLMGVQGINMIVQQTKDFNRFWSTINFVNLFKALIEKALTSRQGSVWLEIPLDIQGKEI
jgi:acetolactate synthase-1/2/3 large subunit